MSARWSAPRQRYLRARARMLCSVTLTFDRWLLPAPTPRFDIVLNEFRLLLPFRLFGRSRRRRRTPLRHRCAPYSPAVAPERPIRSISRIALIAHPSSTSFPRYLGEIILLLIKLHSRYNFSYNLTRSSCGFPACRE